MRKRAADDDDALPAEVVADPVPALAAISPEPPAVEKWEELTTLQRIEAVQNRLMERSVGVLEDALSFSDIDPEDESPPKEWIEKLGHDRAWQKFRVAKGAWLNGKAAPAGIGVAKSVFVSVAKIAASAAQPTAPLASPVQVIVNMPRFEEIDVDE